MTNPPPPRPKRLTPAQALAAAKAARAARTPDQLVTAMTRRASEAVIAAREKSTRWAIARITPRLARLDPYDGHAVQAFTEAAAGQLAIAQKTTAITAAAGQKNILTTMGILVTPRPSSPVNIRAAGADFDGGRVRLQHDNVSITYVDDPAAATHVSVEEMTTVEVLNRPVRAIRYLESRGATRDEALQVATERLGVIVDDNMMLAQRFAEAEVINLAADQTGSRIVGIRRVIHPELSRSGVCGLCAAASDRLYTVRDLLPIHKRCKCTTAPVTEDFDPADALNAIDLSKLYTDAGGTSRAHLKRTRYKIDDHGELGPVLVPERKYKPRGQDADKRSSATYVGAPESKAEIAARHLPILEANLAKLRSDGLSEDSSQVRYHKAQIDKFRADLAANDPSGRSRSESTSQPLKGMKTKQNDPAVPASGGSGGRGGGGDEPPRPPRQNGPISGDDDDPVTRLNRMFSEQTQTATPAQRQSVVRWQGKSDRFYDEVQRAAQDQSADPTANDVADDLQDLMMPLAEDVELWRGIRDSEATFGVPHDQTESLIGADMDVPRFFATTLNLEVTQEFITPGRRPALYKITAQRGTPALWVPPLGRPADAYQQELLFPPGTIVRILDVKRTSSVPIVEVEVSYGEVG